jgi:uncharacterized protein (DUF608 family)
VLLTDPDIPVEVRLKAFNPLIPTNADLSGIPLAVFHCVVENQTQQTLEIAVCASLTNFTGDGPDQPNKSTGKQNFYRKEENIQGIMMTPGEINEKAEAYGSLALATIAQEGVSYQTRWKDRGWGSSLLFFWDDFNSKGLLEEPDVHSTKTLPRGSLSVKKTLPPQASETITFLICWHFPNRYTWTPAPSEDCCKSAL